MSPCSRYSSLQLINISRKIQEESQAHSLSGQDSILDKNVNDKNAEDIWWPGTMESNSVQSLKCCHWDKQPVASFLELHHQCPVTSDTCSVSKLTSYKIKRQANLNCDHVIVLPRNEEKASLNNYKILFRAAFFSYMFRFCLFHMFVVQWYLVGSMLKVSSIFIEILGRYIVT